MNITFNTYTPGNISFNYTSFNGSIVAWVLTHAADTPTDSELDQMFQNVYDGSIKNIPIRKTSEDIDTIEFIDPPFIQGQLTIYLKDGDGWSSLDFFLPDTEKQEVFPFFTSISTASTKQTSPVADSQDIKGTPKIYEIFEEFLLLHYKYISKVQRVTVFDDDLSAYIDLILKKGVTEDQYKQSWPLLKAPDTNSRSYLNFYDKLAVSEPIIKNRQVYYAPDFNGGIPPFYNDPLDGEYLKGLTFPDGSEWDDERDFVGVWNKVNGVYTPSNYNNPRKITTVKQNDSKWKIEIVDNVTTIWTSINSISPDFITNNRYVRRVIDDLTTPTLLPPKPAVYYKGVRNTFAHYEDNFGGSVLIEKLYTDKIPDRRNWEDLSTQEQDLFLNTYSSDSELDGGVANNSAFEALTNYETYEQAINGLFRVDGLKNTLNKLQGEWTNPRYIPEEDGKTVYNTKLYAGDINTLGAGGGVPTADELIAEGWSSTYNSDTHTVVARLVDGVWKQEYFADEIGTFKEYIHKAYPYSALSDLQQNPSLYTPVGINAANNNSDVYSGSWGDLQGTLPPGYFWAESDAIFYYEKQGFKREWSDPKPQLSEGIIQSFIQGVNNIIDFKTDKDNNTTPTQITLQGFLTWYRQREGDDNYIINDDVNEEVQYKWERIVNNGIANEELIYSNIGSITDNTDSLTGLSFEASGRNLIITPDAVTGAAIFRLTQRWIDSVDSSNIYERVSTILVKDISDGLDINEVFLTSDSNTLLLRKNAIVNSGSYAASEYENRKVKLTSYAPGLDISSGKYYRFIATNGVYDTPKKYYDKLRDDEAAGGAAGDVAISILYSTDPLVWEEISSNSTTIINYDDHGFDKESESNGNYKNNVYKFQIGTNKADFTIISRISQGSDAFRFRLTKSPDVFLYNSSTPAFETDEVVLKVNTNIQSPSYSWSAIDDQGNDVTADIKDLAVPETGSKRILSTDFGSSTKYFIVTVEETTTGYTEKETVKLVEGATQGETGEGGVSLSLTNDSQNIACDINGNPVTGALSAATSTLIIREGLLKVDLSSTSDYTVSLVNSDGTSIVGSANNEGVEAEINNGVITVQAVGSGIHQGVYVKVTSGAFSDVIKFSITKNIPAAGVLQIILSNPAASVQIDTDNKIVTSSNSNYVTIGTCTISGYKGGLLSASNLTFSIVGYTSSDDGATLTFSNNNIRIRVVKSTGVATIDYLRTANFSTTRIPFRISYNGEVSAISYMDISAIKVDDIRYVCVITSNKPYLDNNTVQLTALLYRNGSLFSSGLSYRWKRNNSDIPGSSNILNVTQEGYYTVNILISGKVVATDKINISNIRYGQRFIDLYGVSETKADMTVLSSLYFNYQQAANINNSVIIGDQTLYRASSLPSDQQGIWEYKIKEFENVWIATKKVGERGITGDTILILTKYSSNPNVSTGKFTQNSFSTSSFTSVNYNSLSPNINGVVFNNNSLGALFKAELTIRIRESKIRAEESQWTVSKIKGEDGLNIVEVFVGSATVLNPSTILNYLNGSGSNEINFNNTNYLGNYRYSPTGITDKYIYKARARYRYKEGSTNEGILVLTGSNRWFGAELHFERKSDGQRGKGYIFAISDPIPGGGNHYFNYPTQIPTTDVIVGDIIRWEDFDYYVKEVGPGWAASGLPKRIKGDKGEDGNVKIWAASSEDIEKSSSYSDPQYYYINKSKLPDASFGDYIKDSVDHSYIISSIINSNLWYLARITTAKDDPFVDEGTINISSSDNHGTFSMKFRKDKQGIVHWSIKMRSTGGIKQWSATNGPLIPSEFRPDLDGGEILPLVFYDDLVAQYSTVQHRIQIKITPAGNTLAFQGSYKAI